jgi:hypothetical protein
MAGCNSLSEVGPAKEVRFSFRDLETQLTLAAMARREPLWRRAVVRNYFGHLYDEVLELSNIRDGELWGWTSTHDWSRPEFLVIDTVTTLFSVLFMAGMVLYGVIRELPGFGVFLMFLTSVLAIVIFVLPAHEWARVRVGRRYWLGRKDDSRFLRSFPGKMKRFHRPVSESVQRIAGAVNEEGRGCWVFCYTLKDREGGPMGTVFMTQRSHVRLSVWSHASDRRTTLVHIAPSRGLQGMRVRQLMRLVDQCLQGCVQT